MEVEDDIFHIILNCPVLKEIFSKFNATFKEINGKDITNREIAFGNQESGGKNNLRNFLIFIIKYSIFKMRNVNFTNKRLAITAVLKRIHKEIKSELIKKLIIYASRNEISRFKDRFLYKNIFGHFLDKKLIYTLEIN